MRGNNSGAPELKGHRAEVVLEEAADVPPPKVLRTETLEAHGTNTVLVDKGIGVEGARSVMAYLRDEVSNRTDCPLSDGLGRGEIRMEKRRVLVVCDTVFSGNFPVRVGCEIPSLWLPRQNELGLNGPER